MNSIRFNNITGFLFLIIPLIVLLYYFLSSSRIKKGVFLSDLGDFKFTFSFRVIGYYFSVTLLFLGLFTMAFSLTEPQWGSSREIKQYSGIDIMIVFDVSPSMMVKDYGNNTRFDVARYFVNNFIRQREGDRIGLVTFSEKSYLKSPATNNYDLLTDIVAGFEVPPKGSTSIGLGLASGINRLLSITDNKNNQSKIIILVTDGENNSGEIAPQTASDIAKQSGIKIYTIGIGTAEELDMSLLQNIADQTGGEFYFAKNANEIKATFDSIDRLEKQTLETIVFTRYKNMGYAVSIIGTILFTAGLFLYTFAFRRLG